MGKFKHDVCPDNVYTEYPREALILRQIVRSFFRPMLLGKFIDQTIHIRQSPVGNNDSDSNGVQNSVDCGSAVRAELKKPKQWVRRTIFFTVGIKKKIRFRQSA